MRRYVIAGNWKMNMTPNGAKALINEMKPLVAGKDNCDVVLCVPAIDIPAAVEAAKGSNIKIGAENVHFKASGAYTGEISAEMFARQALSTSLSDTAKEDSISVRPTRLLTFAHLLLLTQDSRLSFALVRLLNRESLVIPRPSSSSRRRWLLQTLPQSR